jgi:hypothetical protein
MDLAALAGGAAAKRKVSKLSGWSGEGNEPPLPNCGVGDQRILENPMKLFLLLFNCTRR